MNLLYFSIASLSVFTTLHFFWIPLLERRFQRDRTQTTIGKNVLLSVLAVFRSVALISTLTSTTILILVFLLQLQGRATPEEVLNAINIAKQWKAKLNGFGPAWGITTVLLLTISLVIHARRRSKVRLENIFNKVYDDEYQRIKKLYEQNKLEVLHPSKEMNVIQEKLDQTNEYLTNFDKIELPEEIPPDLLRDELTKQAHLLKENMKALDIQRRLDLKLDEDEVELPKAHTTLEKIQTFFISRGLLNNLNRGTRVVYFASLILLVPSLMGVYSGAVGRTIEKRVVQLQNLKIELENTRIESELQSELAQLGEPKEEELSEEDLQVIEDTARIFEESIAETYLTASAINHTTRFAIRSNVVRDQILNRFTQRSHSKLEKLPSGSKAKTINAVETEVLKVSEDAIGGKNPYAKQGKALRSELQRVARRNPRLVDKLRVELKSFQRAASGKDISRALAKHTLGMAMEGVGEGEIGRHVQKAMDWKTPKTIKTLSEMQSKRFVLNLARGEGIGDAINSVKVASEMGELKPMMRTIFNDLPLNDIHNKLRNYPPSIKSLPEPHVNLPDATAKIEKLRSRPNIGTYRSIQYADAVSNFEDWFPSQLGSENDTPRGKLRDKWASQTRTKSSRHGYSAKTPKAKISSRSFARSRSFFRLRGFSRVGGVLIGQDSPTMKARGPTFIDFEWNTRNSRIQFTLTDSTGRTFKTKFHRMSVAYYALNYAADGRPLAVTMVNAPPMVELKILVHPTLIDTPMGYRMIEIDRFVDTYTGDDQKREEATFDIYTQHALYQLAWANRALVLLENFENRLGLYDELPAELISYKQYTQSIINNSQIRLRAGSAIRKSDYLDDPNHSPLTIKTEFYDEQLVSLIIRYAKKSKTLDQFESSIKTSVRSKSLVDESTMARWFSEPPQFEIWSGVREKEFGLFPQELLMLENSSPPLPLSFILQVAFTSPPSFLNNMDEENAENYSDTEPWEFPLLRDRIRTKVLSRAKADQRSKIILNDLVEFTYLQRFFRMALNGYLGEGFPVERLLELTEILEAYAPKKKTRTLRWNARPGLEAQLRNEMNDENREEITEILSIRKALGISVDERQIRRERYAALPSLDDRPKSRLTQK